MSVAVVCSHPLAADAGRAAMMRGGNAVDAAVATALMLCVVDPANCGLGGYGGAMLVQRSPEALPELVDFNTQPPAGMDASFRTHGPRCDGFLHRGPSVAPSAVAPGLVLAHREFGRLAWPSLLEGPILAAREGVPVGPNLALAIAWLAGQPAHADGALSELLIRGGSWLEQGEIFIQKDLATTLEALADHPEELHSGRVARDICHSVREDGGVLELSDLITLSPVHRPAEMSRLDRIQVFGGCRATTGFGVLAAALEWLHDNCVITEDHAGARHIDLHDRARALQWAWAQRMSSRLQSTMQHTTHLCACDAQGMIVSCTFTHGPLWFGSGMVAGSTGVIMNCGMNLMRPDPESAIGCCAINNLSPVIALRESDGTRFALGSPGGSRIPAIVMQVILDAALGGLPLEEALRQPRLAVRPDGRVEAEPGLYVEPPVLPLTASDFFGPASAISVSPDGLLAVAGDHRFAHGKALYPEAVS